MNQTKWTIILGLAFAFAATALQAGQPGGDKLDLDAEAKQAAKEEEQQMAERLQGVKGKYQRKFFGTFVALAEAPDSKKYSPEVVGWFVTNAADKKPGRKYQVKVDESGDKVHESLKRLDGKILQVTGKLRNIGPDGEAKYLIVAGVEETAPTPPPVERRKLGGI